MIAKLLYRIEGKIWGRSRKDCAEGTAGIPETHDAKDVGPILELSVKDEAVVDHNSSFTPFQMRGGEL